MFFYIKTKCLKRIGGKLVDTSLHGSQCPHDKIMQRAYGDNSDNRFLIATIKMINSAHRAVRRQNLNKVVIKRWEKIYDKLA